MRSVRVKKSNILILHNNLELLLKRILKNPRAQGESYKIVNFNNLNIKFKIIELIKNTWGFLFKIDKNIVGIKYVWDGEIGDEFSFMKMIAPFVEKNSYIVMFSDCGEFWRYFFNGIDCKKQIPDIRWFNLEDKSHATDRQ